MSHLTFETLARLVDETTTELEAAHLATCELCRAELDAMRDDVRTLATLPDLTPAPDAWDALALRLAAEGIVRTDRAGSFRLRSLLQAAAAAVLFAVGLAVGRGTGNSAQPPIAQATLDQAPLAPEAATPPTQRATGAEAGPNMDVAPPPVPGLPAGNANVTVASTGAPAPYAPPRTMDEATALLRDTEELYLGALTRYAELATQADAGDPIARLAALQSIVLTTQAALTQTPADPVINGYHLTALAHRDATLRQVAAVTSDRWY
jgi:hypothetical protein